VILGQGQYHSEEGGGVNTLTKRDMAATTEHLKIV
jgi:hypothetical protein